MTSTKPSPLIVGLGRVGLEFCGVLPQLPDTEAPVLLDQASVQIGGSIAVALATATTMGARARLCCKLADDFLGDHVRSALSHYGVETHAVVAAESQLTAMQFRLLTNRHKVNVFSNGDSGELIEAELDINGLLQNASAFICDDSYPKAQADVCEQAQHRGIPVIFDGSKSGPSVGTLLGLANVAICSERLAAEIAPHKDLRLSAQEIQKLGPSAVIITLGSSGCVGLFEDEWVEEPASGGDTVDTHGAGAVFHGAFVVSLLGNLPFAKCLQFASAAAGLACGHVGAFAGIPRRAAVLAALKHKQ